MPPRGLAVARAELALLLGCAARIRRRADDGRPYPRARGLFRSRSDVLAAAARIEARAAALAARYAL